MKQAAHSSLADHNHAFSETVEPEYSDWAGTALFYSALHAVDAYLDKYKGVEEVGGGHTERQQRIRDDSFLSQQIYFDYRALQDLARQARYQGFRPTAAQLTQHAARLKTLRKKLGC